jgi:hypothetical protein
VVQQYRKLVQLHRDMPDVAAMLESPADAHPDMQHLQAAVVKAGLSSTLVEGTSSGSSSSSSALAGQARAAAEAAAFFSMDSSTSSSSGSEDSSPSNSTSSSRRSTASRGSTSGPIGRRVHGNTKWPPPLSEADVQELLSMSRAWRAMLPELAAKAQQLLVLYNTRWAMQRHDGLRSKVDMVASRSSAHSRAAMHNSSMRKRTLVLATAQLMLLFRLRLLSISSCDFNSFLFSCRLIPHMLQFLRRTRRTAQLPVPVEDLLSVGLVGLRRAAARYDPGRKTRFSTTATVWILQVLRLGE